MSPLCDKVWEKIRSRAEIWKENDVELKTLGKGKKAKNFRIIEVTANNLRTSALPSDRYSKDMFCLTVQLLYERGKEGAELRPTKTSHPINGTIDYVVRPRNVKGKIPPMRATWIGAILVRSGVAIQTKDRPITIRLTDEYLAPRNDGPSLV